MFILQNLTIDLKVSGKGGQVEDRVMITVSLGENRAMLKQEDGGGEVSTPHSYM